MGEGKKWKVMLTEVEKQVLQFVLEMKFASVDILFEEVFLKQNFSKKSAYRIVKNLEDFGYLKSRKGLDGSLRKWYFGTQKGWKRFERSGFPSLIPNASGRIWPMTFDHDLELIKIRQLLNKRKVLKSWESERKLKSEYSKVHGKFPSMAMPDGIATIEETRWAIEFELSNKTPKRYRNKILELQLLKELGELNFDRVLFLTSFPYQQKTISEICSDCGVEFKVLDIEGFYALGEEELFKTLDRQRIG